MAAGGSSLHNTCRSEPRRTGKAGNRLEPAYQQHNDDAISGSSTTDDVLGGASGVWQVSATWRYVRHRAGKNEADCSKFRLWRNVLSASRRPPQSISICIENSPVGAGNWQRQSRLVKLTSACSYPAEPLARLRIIMLRSVASRAVHLRLPHQGEQELASHLVLTSGCKRPLPRRRDLHTVQQAAISSSRSPRPSCMRPIVSHVHGCSACAQTTGTCNNNILSSRQ